MDAERYLLTKWNVNESWLVERDTTEVSYLLTKWNVNIEEGER